MPGTPGASDLNLQFSGSLTTTAFLADNGTGIAPVVPGAFTYPFPGPVTLDSIALIITGLTVGQTGSFRIVDDGAVTLAGPFPLVADGFFTYFFAIPGVSNAGLEVQLDQVSDVVVRSSIEYSR